MKPWTALIGLTLLSPALLAHGPSPRRSNESVSINAPIDAVWAKLAEPCAMAAWHPKISACTADGKDMQLTLDNGGSLTFQIDELDANSHTMYYRFGDGIALETFPVSSLTGKLQVEAEGSGSKVHWAATFYRFDTHNDPEPGVDDDAAREAVEAFIKSGLTGLAAAG